jgi:hypothetical protein
MSCSSTDESYNSPNPPLISKFSDPALILTIILDPGEENQSLVFHHRKIRAKIGLKSSMNILTIEAISLAKGRMTQHIFIYHRGRSIQNVQKCRPFIVAQGKINILAVLSIYKHFKMGKWKKLSKNPCKTRQAINRLFITHQKTTQCSNLEQQFPKFLI